MESHPDRICLAVQPLPRTRFDSQVLEDSPQFSVETELEIGQEEPANIDRFRWQVVAQEVRVGSNLFFEGQQKPSGT
jgi:hypothetical protein